MRRSRSKARKPRYVSLRCHLASPPPETSDMTSAAAVAADEEIIGRRRQFDLFPLHSEHLDRDPPVACLLDERGGAADPTLAAILGGGASSSSGSPSPPSLDTQSMNWEDEGSGDGDGLARRALRGRERWAYWCASSSSSEEEVASTGVVAGGVDLWRGTAATRSLALKLDYEEILAAWSDRGPLYTDGDGTQVVPDLHHQIYTLFDSADIPVVVEVSQGAVVASPWKVPEATGEGNGCEDQVKEESGGGTSTLISREASVRRYKEKRGNRLFAKRIRYEVRKTNAEKRPRIKGRFVKRKDGNVDHS